MKNTAQRDIKLHDSMHTPPTTNEQCPPPRADTTTSFQPIHSASKQHSLSTRYKGRLNGHTKKQIDLHTKPGALRRQQLWYLQAAKMAQRPPPCSHSITIT